MLRAKILTDVLICTSCCKPVSTDGTTIRCEDGHEIDAELVKARWARKWLAEFREWAGRVPSEDT